ncbi:DUF4214 domain-containing protein [Massilia arenosa]|uniref:DUF4214 domain-containing protein n=1 Tax=Zemynaea arenosa TaxID=2561931 RepID=A0A4Y9SGC8_9BURK|nr:S8 family serine peptidase [Massilia arenosa]TFW20386.1 DUF4214 domain-containing protein [Massilia arenosa]
MSSYIGFSGTATYSIDPTANTVQLHVDGLHNWGDNTSKPLRLELWLTTQPWSPSQTNTGYEIAVGSKSSVLGAYEYFSDLNDTVTFLNHPPAGTYYVTLVAAEYSGASRADNGYVADDYLTFPTMVTVGADGRVIPVDTGLPRIDVETEWVEEGDKGAQNMVFTLTLSHASTLPVSVQVDTGDETAAEGYDYQGVHQRVTFAPGATTATVTVPVNGNEYFEPTRAFELLLSDPTNAVAGHTSANGTTAQASPTLAAWGLIFDNEKPDGITLPDDPYFSLQWYLYTTRTEIAWNHATGKGVKIGIFDQGIDPTLAELVDSNDRAAGRTALTLQQGGAPVLEDDNHGTHVAGIIGAARDGEGMVGVAYGARLTSIYTSDTFTDDYPKEIANAFRYALNVDVLNNSWGFGNLLQHDTNWAFLDNAADPRFAPAFTALHDLAEKGRGGLGTVVVQSAGNSFSYGDDTNLHNFQNSRYIITVGASDYFGLSSEFSTTGASILVSAPGGAGYGDYASILTLDRKGGAGDINGDYLFADGTSFAAPIVSGIVAMMLEVNPHLGYRDVQQILAYTAHQTDYGLGDWSSNGATDWNGGGLRYNSVIQASGFGMVDALAAVRLAEAWTTTPQTVANTVEATGSQTVNKAIPDQDQKGITSTIHIDSAMTVERADVTVNITHPFIGDLEVELLSPAGTVSYLMYRPSQGALSAVGSSQENVHFTFDTVLDWGEKATGDWTLTVRDVQTGDFGTFTDWSLDLIGKAPSNSHTFVFTNEYADLIKAEPSRAVLNDPQGVNDTINAAALGSDDRIDLSGATPSVIIDANLTIGAGTVIRNAFGGDGNNILIANPLGGALHGMGGNDSITGGIGLDLLDGGKGNDKIDGGAGTDTAMFSGAWAAYTLKQGTKGLTVTDNTGIDGIDTLFNVERLAFSDKTWALDVDGAAGQIYRLYQAVFDRKPDSVGLGYWVGVIDKGATLLAIADGFVHSNEFAQLYGTKGTNAEILTHFYQNVLHRAPDKSGYDYWLDVLDRGASVAAVLASFSESPENKAGVAEVIGQGFEYTPYLG